MLSSYVKGCDCLMSNYDLITLQDIIVSADPGFASGQRDSAGVIQVRMNNVSSDGHLSLAKSLRVPGHKKQIEKYALEPGDVLFNITNSPELVGKTVIFDGYKEVVLFSNHFLRLRGSPGKLLPSYLKYFLLWHFKNRTFENMATQWVNQATVRKSDLLDLPIALPVTEVQSRITQRLERADRLRRLRQHALDISDQYLQTVFLEMFGDPETNPKGWEREELGELIHRFEGGTNFPPVAGSAPASRYRVLKISAVTWGSFDPAESKPIAVETRIKPEIVVRKGDLLFSRANTSELVGSVAMVAVDPPPVVLPDKVWRIVFGSDSRLDPYYTMSFLRSSFARKQISDLATGSSGSMKNISMGKANTLVLNVPPLALQSQYASVVHKHERLRRMQIEGLRQANLLYETLLEEAFGSQ